VAAVRNNPLARLLAASLAGAVLAGCGTYEAVEEALTVERSSAAIGVELRVMREEREVVCLCASLADDEAERNTGLSGSGDPRPFDAMVFRWDEPTTPVFWMKDTPGSLDAVFVGLDGVVSTIKAMSTCAGGDCPLYTSGEAATFAVELKDAKGEGIRVGDRLALGEMCQR
jgi:uncharacterized membrane protein (UPF0127 family)